MVATSWDEGDYGVSDTDETYVECQRGHRITEFELKENYGA